MEPIDIAKPKIVHISATNVSGSPAGIVGALNNTGRYEATFINLGDVDVSSFSNADDLFPTRDRDEILAVIEAANLIHIHQVVPLNISRLGVDLTSEKFSGKRLLRHWHSEPGHFSRWSLPDVDNFMDERFPHLVLTQYHERYYPWALPVPNLMNTDKLTNMPTSWPDKPILAFSPSNRFKAKERRWASKGYCELIAVLQPLVDDGLITLDVLENLPLEEVLRRKAAATFVVDEVVTGSYHRSGLEGLALGKPTFAYLDARTAASLALLTGTTDCPFLNCRVEYLPLVIRHMIGHPELIREVGERSRAWMTRYYADQHLVKEYTDIYDSLLAGAELELRPKGFPEGGELFLKSGLTDLLHEMGVSHV